MLKPNTPDTNLVSSGAAITASVNKPFRSGFYTGFVAYLNVTAHAGTSPTLDIKFQDSPDGGTTWYDISGAAFTQTTTTNGKQRLVVAATNGLAPTVQAVVVLGGTTPSYTLTLDVSGIE